MKGLSLGGLALTLVIFALGPDAQAQQATPKRGGTVVVATGAEPAVLNPNITTASPDNYVSCNIYEGLVILNTKTSQIEPLLAESWTISPDGKTYTFKLRKTNWHDGKPLTSEDVKYSIEVASKLGPTFATQAGKAIDTVNTPDPQTAEVKLKEPYGPLLLTLTCGFGFAVMPAHLFKDTDARSNPATMKPVGTGPFKFAEWVRGSHLALVRNESYWDTGKPYIDRIVVKILPTGSTRTQALLAGEIDYIPSNFFPPNDAKAIQANSSLAVIPSDVPPNNTYAFFNLKRKPLDDVRVRQALLVATDRKFLLDNVFFGLGDLGKAPWTKKIPWAADPSVDYDKSHPFDPEKAGQMLEEAGYKADASGIRFKLTMIYDAANSERNQAAGALKGMWRRAGIDVTTQPLESAVLMPRVHQDANFDVYISNYSSYADPAIGIGRVYTSSTIGSNFGNASSYSNAEVDALFDKASKLTTYDERGVLYRQIQQILMRDMPVITLVDGQGHLAYSKKLVGAFGWSTNARMGNAWLEQ